MPLLQVSAQALASKGKILIFLAQMQWTLAALRFLPPRESRINRLHTRDSLGTVFGRIAINDFVGSGILAIGQRKLFLFVVPSHTDNCMWLGINPTTIAAFAEIENGSDRTIAVVSGAIVDSAVTDILRRDIKRDDSTYNRDIQNRVFQPEGPLGNLGPKSWMMYLLGYLSENALDDLASFIKIRNLFAHYSEHNSFESQKVRDRCANFNLLKSNVLKSEVVHDNKLTDGVRFSDEGICLLLVQYDEAMRTPKGKFIAVAKLFCAGLELYRDNNLFSKPIF
jgi:DNA-binding MltR family transcriptional regulator